MKPAGEPPKANETCPLCNAPPDVKHAPTCPWWLWAQARRTKRDA